MKTEPDDLEILPNRFPIIMHYHNLVHLFKQNRGEMGGGFGVLELMSEFKAMAQRSYRKAIKLSISTLVTMRIITLLTCAVRIL